MECADIIHRSVVSFDQSLTDDAPKKAASA